MTGPFELELKRRTMLKAAGVATGVAATAALLPVCSTDTPPRAAPPQKAGALGSPLSRTDGRLKITGGARYAIEQQLDGLVYGVTVGSTVPAGRIASIDTRAARSAPASWRCTPTRAA